MTEEREHGLLVMMISMEIYLLSVYNSNFINSIFPKFYFIQDGSSYCQSIQQQSLSDTYCSDNIIFVLAISTALYIYV